MLLRLIRRHFSILKRVPPAYPKLAVQAGLKWSMATPLRFLSYSIDIVLLTAALMLLAVLPSAVFANGWLWTKLSLLVVYVVLGSFALKRAQTQVARAGFFVAAVLVFAAMYFIARTHQPLGFVNVLLS